MPSRGAAIDISWADHKLAKSCASNASGLRRFGAEQWAVLQRRLGVLLAAGNLDEVGIRLPPVSATSCALHLSFDHYILWLPEPTG